MIIRNIAISKVVAGNGDAIGIRECHASNANSTSIGINIP